ncbi:MAG: elongation factor P [Bdellovibrionales bacterium]|nr:elongation factor P [Bdellovibrionales bacterium]
MKGNDIRKGMVIMYNGVPHRVMEFQHSTPGNLRARVQTKLRNLLAGSQTEVRFSATEDIQTADVFTVAATYLYGDATGYHFMNSESYEQVTFDEETLGDARLYLQDGMEVQITLYEEQPIGIQLPMTVILTVTETEPAIRGATATNSPKPAKTETGLSLSVPPFVKEGEKIIVNTAEGTYVSRAD